MTEYRFSDNLTTAVAYGVTPVKVWAEWQDNRGRPHLVETTWRTIGGRLEPIAFELRTALSEDNEAPKSNLPPADSAPALDARDLRNVCPGVLLREARRFVAASTEPSEPVEYDTLAGRLEALGNGARDDANAMHALVAEVWHEARRRGVAPGQAVKDHFPEIKNLDAAYKRIQRARNAGYLPPTSRGRSVLTDDSAEAGQ